MCECVCVGDRYFTFNIISFFALIFFFSPLFPLWFARYASSIRLYMCVDCSVDWFMRIFCWCLLLGMVACSVNTLNTDSDKKHWNECVMCLCTLHIVVQRTDQFCFGRWEFLACSLSITISSVVHSIDCDSFSFEFIECRWVCQSFVHRFTQSE